MLYFCYYVVGTMERCNLNTLFTHILHMSKITKEKFKVEHNVFDASTNRIIFKLMNEGHFDGLEGPIQIGKEANVFSALKGTKKVAVKIADKKEKSNID